MAATVRIGNVWAHSLGRFGECEWSETWAKGCEQASWTMRATTHPAVRVGARVEVHDGSGSEWAGRLVENGRDGNMVATGLWHQGEKVAATTAGGAATFNPDIAVDAAIAAGQVSWRRVGSLGAALPTPDTDPDKPMMLTALLDACMGETGDEWRVDGRGNLTRESRPTVARWHVAPGLGALTPADDDFITAVRVYYLAGVGDLRTATAFEQRSVDLYGWREGSTYDIVGEGVMLPEDAEAMAADILDALGPRMAFTESLELAPGELTTIGGSAAGQSLRAGDVIRIAGVWDPTRPRGPLPYIERVIGRAQHSDSRIVVAAQDQPRRSLASIIGAAA